MRRVPKFIRSDKVKHRDGHGQIMSIEKFKTVQRLDKTTRIYTGLVICFWFEGEKIKKDTFHEDDLELAEY